MSNLQPLNTDKSKHIIVGLSGGVDSAVAAFLLKEAGFFVQAAFMKNWQDDDSDSHCPASVDMADAQAVCDRLGIELIRVNFADEYWQSVFSIFLQEYRQGRTPNPDVLCNSEIKFKAFLNFAKGRGADSIATGHYARLQASEHGPLLLKGLDHNKDQSYFLHRLTQTQLQASCFPIGHLAKPEVRTIAKKIGLSNYNKKDSTGICFIGERKFKEFLANYLPAQPGNIETETGEIIGRHDGLMFYTIGQRQGLLIGGKKDKAELPWYVAQKDMSRNTLIVVQGSDHPKLYQSQLNVCNIHWIAQTAPDQRLPLKAKTRYRQADQPCQIDAIDNKQYRVLFHEPQRAITPGQSIVFYQNEICLGGGVISLIE
jgi:tRNA-uridine 2-sulfurtransferase